MQRVLPWVGWIALIVALIVIGSLLKEPEAEEHDIAAELAPHTVFELGPLEVTSTIINTWVMIPDCTIPGPIRPLRMESPIGIASVLMTMAFFPMKDLIPCTIQHLP